ncbi:DUF91 domain-containing protein [Halobacteriales archaeon SW_7_68_16]|nr:MAG: DUF91 domain-containing protein [Halobacteriales archaeon SW_7_68_16]
MVYDGHETERHRGRVIVLVKPDGTVLVHDADGYQPAAWLTRADAVACSVDDGFRITARDGDTALRVRSHADATTTAFPVTDAGTPVGDCPDCGQRLVRVRGGVTCIGCGERYGLPAAATVTDETCSCGCPRLRVERGVTHDVCLDRTCEPLVDSVRAAFDREWTCPECGSDLRIVRRGDLLVGCDAYPDCEVAYSLPVGPLAGTCDCGLPTFDTPSGRRCLDTTCERPRD